MNDLLVDGDSLLGNQGLIKESCSSQRETLMLQSERELKNGASYRQCLSGDVRLAMDGDANDENDMRVNVLDENQSTSHEATPPAAAAASSSPISVTQQMERPAERVESRIVRTKSMDRRMCEAFQFAEAVGEILPPLNHTIIEGGWDDDDDDYDGNAKEIRLDDAGASSSGRRDSNSKPALLTDQTRPVGAEGAPTTIVSVKTRPQWPFSSASSLGRSTFLFQLPDGVSPPDFVYKGICANPPEITTHGVSRGNYAQLHRKAWLEVSDKYHRYGKNLRLYYRYWESLGFPTNSFFDWLDSKGEAAGQLLPHLDECPRSQLDSDTVLYITNPDITHGYSLNIIPDEKGRGLVLDVDGEKVKTGNEGWIFVLRDNVMYGALKITSISGHSKQRFHHSSFFGGKAVAAAGIIFTDDDGYLIRLYPHSGHYRPGEAHIQRMLFFLHHKGVDLRTFEMDTQQILHVARDFDTTNTIIHTTIHHLGDNNNNNNSTSGDQMNKKKKACPDSDKKKKVQSLQLKPAVYVACFLAHKARFVGAGIFTFIHKIRKADVTTVSEALDAVDDGGYWKKLLREGKEQQQQQPC
jgi:hypothetical protein